VDPSGRDADLPAHGDRSIAATQWLYGYDAEKIE
jgi:hypothetical protein